MKYTLFFSSFFLFFAHTSAATIHSDPNEKAQKTDFLRAAYQGHLPRLKALLPNEKAQKTDFLRAAYQGHLPLLKDLLRNEKEKKLNLDLINTCNREGRSGLFWLLYRGICLWCSIFWRPQPFIW